MRIKNKDIADKLGISPTAVSLALNGRKGVSEETRKKVYELINKENQLASGVTAEITPTDQAILFIIHKKTGAVIVDKPFFARLLEQIQSEAQKNSFNLIVSHYTPDQNLEDYVRSLMDYKDIKGVIIQGTELTYEDMEIYSRLALPIVIVDSEFDLLDFDCISLDDENSFFRAVSYAYNCGHRNIGFLKSNRMIQNFRHHYDGFMRAIHYYNLEEYNHLTIELSPNLNDSYEEMREFLRTKGPDVKLPTLFLSDLDYMALGAMKALQSEGYKVPDDVSIIGYEDLDACIISSPTLTSIHIDRTYLGHMAVKRLMEKILEHSDYHIHATIRSSLVVRDSVKVL